MLGKFAQVFRIGILSPLHILRRPLDQQEVRCVNQGIGCTFDNRIVHVSTSFIAKIRAARGRPIVL